MVSIQIDDLTAKAIEQYANDAGVSIADYVRMLVPRAGSQPRPSWDEIEKQIMSASGLGPDISTNYSRAEIYADHD